MFDKTANFNYVKKGSKAVAELVRRQCRCHGVSGSCEFKTCWQSMPRLGEVGQHLKNLYDRSAVQVAKHARKRLRRKNKFERRIRIRTNELVYVNRSPNYCVRNANLGILGTYGRQCNKTYSGSDSCDVLCCGRGYDTRLTVRYERCHCKFVWCCYVNCKTCSWEMDVHTCK
ncbi:unnamed protein product [Soboliphyme baturini]|uniref:Protein Wnt n=1 Tax=Soboliphyme baturini TaxID=241478 RepID=A0A183IRF2_9BILA|nr:unnamed protein product [Soboliphyme baturini]